MLKEETRREDERLREQLRHADIGKLKKLMTPLIEKRDKTSLKKRPKR